MSRIFYYDLRIYGFPDIKMSMMIIPRWKHISLHVAFLLPVMALILITAGLTSYLSFHNGQQAINEMTRDLRNEITARIEEHLQRYLRVPYLVNQSVFNALSLGVLDLQQPQRIGRSLCQQLQLYPELNSISFGNPQGGAISAQRQEDDSVQMLMTQNFMAGLYDVYKPENRKTCTLLGTLPSFDARKHEWYRTAVAQQQIHWSPFYLIPYQPEPGFSLSQPLYIEPSIEPAPDEEKELQGVLMTELRLSRLGDFLRSLNVGRSGRTFIMQRDGLLVASSESIQPFSLLSDGSLQQREAIHSREPLIQATARFLQSAYPDLNTIKTHLQLDFSWQMQHEFLQVSPFQDDFGLDWLIVVVLPEADFMQHVHENTQMTLWLWIGSLLLGLVLSWRLSQAIIHPIRGLSSVADQLIENKWPVQLPDSHIIEIKQLSSAFQHMSEQLRGAFILLEQKVKERTQALQDSLDALECSEQALQKSEAKYHTLVEQIPVTVYEASLDNRSKMLYISPQIEKLSAIKDTIWLNNPNTWLEHLDKDDRIRVLDEYQTYLQTLSSSIEPIETEFSTEYRFLRPDGQEIWINDDSLPVYDEQGRCLFLRGVMQDITERKAVEKELLTYRKHLEYLIKARTRALEDLNEQLKGEILERKRMEVLEREYMEKLAHTSRISMLGEMAAQIAHQLNQPLAAVASYSVACKYLLQSFTNSHYATVYQKKIQTTLEKINDEAQHAGAIIHRLRALSRSNEMETSMVDINKLVRDAEKLVEVEAKWRNIELKLELSAQLPCVMVDKVLLEQVILNLAHNAVAALDEITDRTRRLTVKTEEMKKEKEVRIHVMDNGPGLPEEMIEQVFTSFFTTKPHGIGLGLSVCLSIAKAHEGRLWVTPNAEHGTVFTLSLPIYQNDSYE